MDTDAPTAPKALDARIARVPLAFAPDRADAALSVLDPVLRGGQLGELLHGTAGSSAYLARLIERHGEWLAETAFAAPEVAFATLLDTMAAETANAASSAAVLPVLRRCKTRAALLIALADLSGAWSLGEVTGALTHLADRSLEAASGWLLAQEIAKDKLPGMTEDDLADGAGYVLLAMGKMGAFELNYSSDIDLIALFDDARFEGADVLDARARYIHVTRQLVKFLSENTGDGYVFRTDLRLRPAPSTTPVCMAMDAAERYYESIGRTWERAAHIKARPLIDVAAGAAYLKTLTPFIWRRNLDFAAIEDTHEMLRKIRAQKARFTPGALPGHDLKLGPGGIREIEFFTQTRQLIMGGRDPELRDPTTLGGLAVLARKGWITEDVQAGLTADYTELRTIEHRLQMLDDAQTHAIPKSEEARGRLAAVCGEGDLARFEGSVLALLRRVHGTTEELFSPGGPGSAQAPTATATTPDEAALAEAGFARPADAARQIERWHEGGIAATRGERARTLFRSLEPQIIARLTGATDPDQALSHFDSFLSGLHARGQVFSLFSANPQLLDLIVEICAAAPRLAGYLGRHPQTLDALVEQDFWEPLPGLTTLLASLDARLDGIDDYERVLDASRRWAREHWFRAGVHVLRNVSEPEEAGRAFTAIAEASLTGLLPHVIADFATRHGAPPGNGMAILAMGKLGSGEMTAGSDLDLITIYDGAGVEASDGRRPLAPGTYYPRLTQALVAALTAQTAEGALYEVDMRLRPSGRQGPVAVSISSFEKYQLGEAWVWEHMALTRARVLAGPPELRERIEAIASEALAGRIGATDVMDEARTMRARLIEANAAERDNPWSLKHAAGGLMEIEFLAQTGALLHGLSDARRPAIALPTLAGTGWLSADAAQSLAAAARLLSALQHVERVALDAPLAPDAIGPELRQVLARAAEVEDFAQLSARLETVTKTAAGIVAAMFDPPG